ncbi:ABC transporter transmembrane domain-containing protein [Nocardia thailandica]|uniref:ABC transporter transmembrane domain-containing protein n=1 Tax=Nocardia thailandica TaxID=257275 RepID=UPI0002F17102|nr:ABC transporter transmembrane domain-containing protein [Nocardia thailandica]
MTVEEAALPAARAGNRPPREAAKAKKQAEARARQEIMAPVRVPLLIASLLTVLVSAATVVPFVLVVEACRELLDDPIDTDRVWRLFLLAALVLAGRAVLQAVILTGTHLVDGGFQLAVRRRLARKLSRVPLGWFGEHISGEVKKYLRDDVEALHYLVAHARVDFVGALTVPLITLVYLFAVEWRLALVLLLPVLGYALLFGRMMDRDGRDRVLVYNRAEERTQQAVIEFVDGIGVVRAFGQAGKAHGGVPGRRRPSGQGRRPDEDPDHRRAVRLRHRRDAGLRDAARRRLRAGLCRPRLGAPARPAAVPAGRPRHRQFAARPELRGSDAAVRP